MELKNLTKTTQKGKKRVGRGYGSGKGGHTVGRGSKGTKARGKVGLLFEGTKVKKSLLKRLPLRRGKGKLKSLKQKPLIVNLKHLNLLNKGTLVNVENLVKAGLVEEKQARLWGVKILGDGELKVALKVALPCSSSAQEKIKKAGGEVVKKAVVAPKVEENKEEKKEKKEERGEKKEEKIKKQKGSQAKKS
ncbi:50S ribosomal protein L15 [Patescibacteria group bacterium]|nr:50S ribosomal protein L15 [Patescibacteria group bacterium]